MKCCQPVLIAVPMAALPFWEGELAFWAGPSADVISWTGSNATRATLVDNELWLHPSSLDSRACTRPRDHLPSKVCPALLLADGTHVSSPSPCVLTCAGRTLAACLLAAVELALQHACAHHGHI